MQSTYPIHEFSYHTVPLPLSIWCAPQWILGKLQFVPGETWNIWTNAQEFFSVNFIFCTCSNCNCKQQFISHKFLSWGKYLAYSKCFYENDLNYKVTWNLKTVNRLWLFQCKSPSIHQFLHLGSDTQVAANVREYWCELLACIIIPWNSWKFMSNYFIEKENLPEVLIVVKSVKTPYILFVKCQSPRNGPVAYLFNWLRFQGFYKDIKISDIARLFLGKKNELFTETNIQLFKILRS